MSRKGSFNDISRWVTNPTRRVQPNGKIELTQEKVTMVERSTATFSFDKHTFVTHCSGSYEHEFFSEIHRVHFTAVDGP